MVLAALALPGWSQAVTRQIEEAVRAHWLAHAREQGWQNPEVEVTLAARAPTGLRCTAPPEVVVTDGRHASRMQLRATCAGPVAWQHDFVARVRLSADVLVARRAIAAGRPLDEADIETARRDVTATPDALADGDAALGQSSRRALKAGQVLQQRLLQQAVLIRRGAAVRIVARQGGVVVEAAGEAQEAGVLDQVIRVRNTATGKMLQARVVDSGVVEPTD